MWGTIPQINSKNKQTKSVSFLKTLQNYNQASVTFAINQYSSTAVGYTDDCCVSISNMTNNSMSVLLFDAGGNSYEVDVRWEVKGYIV